MSQYKETCEVLIYYTTIGGEDIKDHVKKSIMNLLQGNIYVHSRMLIAEFPGDILKLVSEIKTHCSNMNFAEKNQIL